MATLRQNDGHSHNNESQDGPGIHQPGEEAVQEHHQVQQQPGAHDQVIGVVDPIGQQEVIHGQQVEDNRVARLTVSVLHFAKELHQRVVVPYDHPANREVPSTQDI